MPLGETISGMVFNNCVYVCQQFPQRIPWSHAPTAKPIYEFSCLTLKISIPSLREVAAVHPTIYGIVMPGQPQLGSEVLSANRYLSAQGNPGDMNSFKIF